jgi:hypothetical protein
MTYTGLSSILSTLLLGIIVPDMVLSVLANALASCRHLTESGLFLLCSASRGAMGSCGRHAKVTSQPGSHARRPLAARASHAYLCALPDPIADFAAVLPSGAPSHGLK